MTDDKHIGASPAPAAADADGGPVRNLMNAARAAKGAALLCFLLPWVTISCGRQPWIETSGLGLATGKMKVLPAARDALGSGGGSRQFQSFSDAMRPDVLVIVAAVLIVAGLVLTLVLRRRPATLAGMVTSVSALVLIAFDVLVRIKGGVEAQLNKGGDLLAQTFSVATAFGFWLTVAALAAAAILLKIVHGRLRATTRGQEEKFGKPGG